MNRKNFLLSMCAVAGFFFGMGQAQAKPNFSGEWKLNAEKSNFGPAPAPDKMSMKVDHQDPKMNVHSAQSGPQGDMEYDVKYTTDGKETTNKLNTPGGEMEAKSTAVWEGDALIITTKMDMGGSEIVVKGKWTLSEDGKTVTNATKIVTPQGEFEMTAVMDKVDSK